MKKTIAALLRGKRTSSGRTASPGHAEAPPPSQLSAPPLGSDALHVVVETPKSEGQQQPQQQQQLGADGLAPPDNSTMWKRRGSMCRWALDFAISVTVLGLLAAVEYGWMPSPRTGFYCNDPNISFKFRGDTVATGVLLVGSFVLPLLALWLVEATLASAHRGTGVLRSVRLAARPALCWYREFVLGLGVVMLVTDAMKLLVSEPRPHFLDTCRPDAARGCASATQWVDDFACTNTVDSAYLVRDSMRSFPSGHTSISVFTALFVMIYLRRRMLRDVSLLLVPWLQGLFLLWALVCSLTRITDHRHHWWDVLAGSVVGVASAVYTVRMFCDDFRPRHVDDADDSLSSSPAPGLGRGLGLGHGDMDGKGLPGRPLLNGHGHGHAKDCACPCPELDRDTVPARRLLSSSSSCASSLTANEERELREVSSTS